MYPNSSPFLQKSLIICFVLKYDRFSELMIGKKAPFVLLALWLFFKIPTSIYFNLQAVIPYERCTSVEKTLSTAKDDQSRLEKMYFSRAALVRFFLAVSRWSGKRFDVEWYLYSQRMSFMVLTRSLFTPNFRKHKAIFVFAVRPEYTLAHDHQIS